MTSISIASIETANRLRALDPSWVGLLAEEIAIDGLVEPVRVALRGNGYKLIDGARRIAAYQALDRDEIEAVVEEGEAFSNDAAVRLAEIKGHMLQGELTALDRAVTVSAWCDLYKAANGVTKRGPKSKLVVVQGTSDEALEELSTTMGLNWSDAARTALNLGKMTLFRHLKVARIEQDVRAMIGLHPVSNIQRELLLLADLTRPRQIGVASMLMAQDAQATSVSEAIALLDQLPVARPLPVYEKLQQRFSTLKATEQDRFFDLNADLIERWMARRVDAQSKKNAA